MADYRPHEAAIVVCVECQFRYVAVFPSVVKFPLECGKCGQWAVEIDIQSGPMDALCGQ